MDGTGKIGGSASGHSDQRTGKNTAPFFNGSGALCKVDRPFSLVCLCMLLLRKDIPKATGTWAQGGIGLYLCDANWKAKYDAELTPYNVNDEEYRAGMIVNNQTNYVYLFVSTALAVTVVDFRAAMMGYLGLIDGGSNRGFRAIMVDGGRSAQLWNKTLNAYPLGGVKLLKLLHSETTANIIQ